MAFCCLLWAGLREEAWANHFLSSFCVIHSCFCSINTFCDFFIRFMISLGFILSILKFSLFVFPLNHFVVCKSESMCLLKRCFKLLGWLERLLICVFRKPCCGWEMVNELVGMWCPNPLGSNSVCGVLRLATVPDKACSPLNPAETTVSRSLHVPGFGIVFTQSQTIAAYILRNVEAKVSRCLSWFTWPIQESQRVFGVPSQWSDRSCSHVPALRCCWDGFTVQLVEWECGITFGQPQVAVRTDGQHADSAAR